MKVHARPSVSYASRPRYRDYVEALSLRNPSLSALHKFLSNPKARRHGCRLGALDFRKGSQRAVARRKIDIGELYQELHNTAMVKGTKPNSEDLQGRILIMEDLTVHVIELLGAELNLDPTFLAMHLHTVQRKGMQHQIPDDATLPSRSRSTDYMNISYQHATKSDDQKVLGKQFLRDAAIDRKLVYLRSGAFGFAQYCTSVVKVQRSANFWLGM